MQKNRSFSAAPSPDWNRTSEPPSPRSPTTPKILNQHERKGADHLRAQFAEIIDDFQPKERNVDILIESLRQDCEEEDVWVAALTSRFYDQDIPLCECAVRNYAPLIDAFLTRSPLSVGVRERVLEACGQYGQTALQHAIASCHWRSASMLIRHGADIGIDGDSLGVVAGLQEAATIQRAERGSWRSVDSKLRDLFSTITSLYGNEWQALDRGQSNRTGVTASDFVSSCDGNYAVESYTPRAISDTPDVYGLHSETESVEGQNYSSEPVKVTMAMRPAPEREHPPPAQKAYTFRPRPSVAASSDMPTPSPLPKTPKPTLKKKNSKDDPFGNPARSSRSSIERARRQLSDDLCKKYLG